MQRQPVKSAPKPASRKKVQVQPICFAIQSSRESAQTCITAMENLMLANPKVNVKIEAVKDIDRRVIEFVLAITPPKGRNWDKPTGQLKSMHTFMQSLLIQMNGYLPRLVERPDEQDRENAELLLASFPPVFSSKIA